MVYKHFGKEIISNATRHVWNEELTPDQVEFAFDALYKNLILEVDAIDNGVSVAADTKYGIGTGLASRIARLNPDWNEEVTQETQHV